MENGQENLKPEENQEQPWIIKYFTPEVITSLKKDISSFDHEDSEYLPKVRSNIQEKIGELIVEASEKGITNEELRSLRFDISVLLDPKIGLAHRTVEYENASSIKFLNKEFHLKLPKFRLLKQPQKI